jgi:thioredoxin-dependent peroxiredoxin
MRKMITAAIALAVCAIPASAALQAGKMAPDFVTQGARGGKAFKLQLREQLRHGPVVLYFYPKAFTAGCTLEAKAFSDAMPKFRKAGAQVIGMSADDLDTLKKFSVEACRSTFPVASASKSTIQAYDVAMGDSGLSNRTSYVIDQKGRIRFVHSDGDWSKHVEKTLAAVQALKSRG